MSLAIVEQLRRRGIASKPSIGPEILVCCPFCISRGTTPDRRYRLGVNTETGMGHCFNCGYRTRSRALRDLRIAKAVSTAAAPERRPEVAPPDDFQPLRKSDRGYWERKAWRYLERRGVSGSQMRRHGIGLSLTGRAHHRVVFPIRGGGEARGWSARSITEATPKWLHSVGLASCYVARRVRPGGAAVVTEGILDALAVARGTGYGVGVVALLGTRLTPAKWGPLEPCRDVLLWLDPDQAGVSAMGQLAPELADRGKRVWVPPQLETDPGDLPDDCILPALRARKPWTPAEQTLRMAGLL